MDGGACVCCACSIDKCEIDQLSVFLKEKKEGAPTKWVHPPARKEGADRECLLLLPPTEASKVKSKAFFNLVKQMGNKGAKQQGRSEQEHGQGQAAPQSEQVTSLSPFALQPSFGASDDDDGSFEGSRPERFV